MSNQVGCDEQISVKELDPRFKNLSLEKRYEEKIKLNFMKSAIIFSSLSLIYSICILIYQEADKKRNLEIENGDSVNDSLKSIEKKNRIHLFLKIYTLIVLGISLINFILNIVGFKKRNLMNYLHFLLLMIFGLQYINLREILHFHLGNNYGISSFIECIFYFCFLFMVDCNFILILLSICIITTISLLIGHLMQPVPFYEIVLNILFMLFFAIFSYFVVRKKKSLFYNKYENTKKNYQFENLLNNLQNGIIIVEKKKIRYFNEYINKNLKFMLEKVENSPLQNKNYDYNSNTNTNIKKTWVYTNSEDENNNYLQINNNSTIRDTFNQKNEIYSITQSLFINLENINKDLPAELIELISNENLTLDAILEFIEQNKKFRKFFQNSQFIGVKEFEEFDNTINLKVVEIFLRVIEDDQNFLFEFILNDVTRMKMIEEKRAQMKYKSLFLSKVAHEFKNPLIIIQELVDEILEEALPKFKRHENLIDNLQLSKNLSSYLLMLIKDFEVISKKENMTKIEINPVVFNLREELDFLRQIVRALILKKYSSRENSPIKFDIKISKDVPEEIFTDRIRLSQILINLLSNSIKFTHSGRISLIVEVNSHKLKLTVKDEGVGIPEKEVKNLFKHFFKHQDINNPYGSGLGLFIANELCSLLGGNIKFECNNPRGCVFSFEIDYQQTKYLINSTRNYKTLYNNDLEQCLQKQKNKSDNNIVTEPIFNKLFDKNVNNYNSLEDRSFETIIKNDDSPLKKIIITEEPLNDLKLFVEETNEENNYMINNQFLINISNNQISSLLINSPTKLRTKESLKFQKTETIKDFLIETDFINDRTNVKKMSKKYSTKPSSHKTEISFEDEEILNKNIKNICIIIADDEKFIRNSTIRQIDKYFSSAELKFSINLSIIEVTDGIECLYAVFNAINKKMKIDLIITDETMEYMSGSMMSEILAKIMPAEKIPVSIVTAYEDQLKYMTSSVCGVFSKPINFKILQQIFKNSKTEL